MDRIMLEIERKLHKNPVEVHRFCDSFESIYIYGAGGIGKKVARYLEIEGIKFIGFVVSEGQMKSSYYCNYPVFEIESLNINDSIAFLLAVSEQYKIEIKSGLEKLGVKWQNIYMQDIICGKSSPSAGLIPDRGRIMASFDRSSNDSLFSSYSELDELGEHYQTDKRCGYHNYLNKYEFFLRQYRDVEMTVIELGVFNGSSVKMWRDYFNRATIVGVDIDDKCRRFAEKDVSIEILDLSLPQNIIKLCSYKPKIVIDDASHICSHQIMALSILIDSLLSGGIYIIEDLETSFPASRNVFYNDSSVTAFEFLSSISEIVTGREYLRDTNISPALYSLRKDIEKIAEQLELIAFISGSCVMVKR